MVLESKFSEKGRGWQVLWSIWWLVGWCASYVLQMGKEKCMMGGLGSARARVACVGIGFFWTLSSIFLMVMVDYAFIRYSMDSMTHGKLIHAEYSSYDPNGCFHIKGLCCSNSFCTAAIINQMAATTREYPPSHTYKHRSLGPSARNIIWEKRLIVHILFVTTRVKRCMTSFRENFLGRKM